MGHYMDTSPLVTGRAMELKSWINPELVKQCDEAELKVDTGFERLLSNTVLFRIAKAELDTEAKYNKNDPESVKALEEKFMKDWQEIISQSSSIDKVSNHR